MASLLRRFLLFLLLHLGCFVLFRSRRPAHDQDADHHHSPSPKRKKIDPAASRLPKTSLIPRSVLSFLSSLLSSASPKTPQLQPQNHDHHQPAHHLQPLPLSPVNDRLTTDAHKSGGQYYCPRTQLLASGAAPAARIRPAASSFAARGDIFPCSACGEVLANAKLLELHQASRHSLSELREGHSGKNVVHIIFRSGWKGTKPPVVHRILKIHNSPKALARFEEYRELVRSRAARSRRVDGDQRCVADGNERLRFYSCTVLCALGRGEGNQVAAACAGPYCTACGIVRQGFAGKAADLEGIATHGSGWGAHEALPEEVEREFAFLGVRRAVVVCRVVAGRVARGGEEADDQEDDHDDQDLKKKKKKKKKGAWFDSVVPAGRREEEELLVFNPRAVLPCFLVVYSAAAS